MIFLNSSVRIKSVPCILIQIKQLSLNSFILNKDFLVSFILITEIITGKITVILKCLSISIHEGSEKCIFALNLYRFCCFAFLINMH